MDQAQTIHIWYKWLRISMHFWQDKILQIQQTTNNNTLTFSNARSRCWKFFKVTGNSVYKPVLNSLCNILEKHQFELKEDFNIKLSEKDMKIPLLYWNSKQHKTPYKAHFIAGATHCTTKSLAVELSIVMKCIKTHFKAYCEQIHQRTRILPY